MDRVIYSLHFPRPMSLRMRVIAFPAADSKASTKATDIDRLVSWKLDPLFTAVVQATEEAVDNALVAAETMSGPNYWVVPELPKDQLKEILRQHSVLR